MAKTLTEIQRDSDLRRGVKAKGYKLKVDTIDTIAALAKEQGIPQNQLIEEAIALYVQQRS